MSESQLLEVWNSSCRWDPMTPGLLAEKLSEPCELRLAEVGGSCVGWGVGVRRGARGVIKMLCVRPEYRRQGHASRLLAELEQALSGVEELRWCESAPNYLQPGIDVRYTAGHLFAARRGYVKIGETYNLSCPLSGWVSPTSSDSGVARARPEDRAEVVSWIEEQFPGWLAEVVACFENDPITLHLARRQGRVVAFAAYDSNNRGTGWFGPMGSAPDQRGQGLGAVLLHRCLDDLRDQGLERAIIPWVGPYEFYSRACGAYIERVFWRFAKLTK